MILFWTPQLSCYVIELAFRGDSPIDKQNFLQRMFIYFTLRPWYLLSVVKHHFTCSRWNRDQLWCHQRSVNRQNRHLMNLPVKGERDDRLPPVSDHRRIRIYQTTPRRQKALQKTRTSIDRFLFTIRYKSFLLWGEEKCLIRICFYR